MIQVGILIVRPDTVTGFNNDDLAHRSNIRRGAPTTSLRSGCSDVHSVGGYVFAGELVCIGADELAGADFTARWNRHSGERAVHT